MRRGDSHEAVSATLLHSLLACAHQRIVGPGERNPVHHHELTARSWHIDALPERQRAEEAGLRVGGEILDQLAQRLLALEQNRLVLPAPQLLGRGLRSAHGREEPERTSAGRLHQLGEFVEHVGA